MFDYRLSRLAVSRGDNMLYRKTLEDGTVVQVQANSQIVGIYDNESFEGMVFDPSTIPALIAALQEALAAIGPQELHNDEPN